MNSNRRTILTSALAVAGGAAAWAAEETKPMYGLIGKMTATEGKRDELLAILLDGTGAMPGCLSYVVATDPADGNAIWITEVWDSKENHAASLTLPAVKTAIAAARPMIAGFSNRVETVPCGGLGIPAVKSAR